MFNFKFSVHCEQLQNPNPIFSHLTNKLFSVTNVFRPSANKPSIVQVLDFGNPVLGHPEPWGNGTSEPRPRSEFPIWLLSLQGPKPTTKLLEFPPACPRYGGVEQHGCYREQHGCTIMHLSAFGGKEPACASLCLIHREREEERDGIRVERT